MVWRRRTVWLSSLAASAVLLGFVVAQVDWPEARRILGGIDRGWVAAGIVLLLIEGLVTAARLHLLAFPATSYTACLQTTAWYVLLLMGLPARLGEVAGIAVVARHMRQSPGAATANLLFQRLFDMLLLMLLLGGVCALAASGPGLKELLLLGVGVFVALLAVVIYFEQFLGLLARPLLERRRQRWPRRFLRVILQARALCRHHLTRTRTLKLAVLTFAKWAVNLGGIACVVVAVVPSLPAVTALGLGIVYNLSAVIPVQTVGGFGVSEAVLMGSFRWLGYSFAVGAPIAIAIRLALISAPLLFWMMVVAVVQRSRPVETE